VWEAGGPQLFGAPRDNRVREHDRGPRALPHTV
jgi:hypothetical protein